MAADEDRIQMSAGRSDGVCPAFVPSIASNEGNILSTESIASPSAASAGSSRVAAGTGAGATTAAGAEQCAACGAPLADDQRYCLECGERRAPISSVLLGGPPATEASQARTPPMVPPSLPSTAADGAGRGNAVTVLAGVGVLLLAMGVGVLIGRSSAPKQSVAPAQTISVTQPAAAGTGAAATTTPTTPEASAKTGASTSKGAAKKGAASTGESKASAPPNESHPAPPTVLKNLSTKKGKNYEQESKNLPNVISTG
jgi:hypothetical protein